MSRTKDNKHLSIKIILFILIALLVSSGSYFGISVAVRKSQFAKITTAENCTLEEEAELNTKMQIAYPTRFKTLSPLPYNLSESPISLLCQSAILIDVGTGNIIYEKNPDEIIPPASMTKLFVLYIVDEEVSAGNLSYDQIIPLPKESWACNAPPHSSLMFLGEGQIVTLEEILLGLSICSGNDAAYAIAYTISGSMENFVAKMNNIAAELGLENTSFVECSGYSEENKTTAREMAKFCRIYLTKHPESLQKFHSVKSFTYPKAHNMAPGDTYGPQDFSNGFPAHITMGITQPNTNPMLDYPGCDGLKTGYIEESGYNLSLTAQRDGTRFLSVTMKGPGANPREGQQGRIIDGTTLMDYAFNNFADIDIDTTEFEQTVKVYGAETKAIKLVPAFDASKLCIPFVAGNTINDNLEKITIEKEYQESLFGEITQGQSFGSIRIKLNNYILDTIPLVADRNVTQANSLIQFIDNLIR